MEQKTNHLGEPARYIDRVDEDSREAQPVTDPQPARLGGGTTTTRSNEMSVGDAVQIWTLGADGIVVDVDQADESATVELRRSGREIEVNFNDIEVL